MVFRTATLAASVIAFFTLIGSAWLVHAPGVPTVIAIPDAAASIAVTALFLAGLKGGLLTFGGAYTAIPFARADTVGRGWLSDATFLDGIAVAGVLPAPLVIFARFVGYVAGGLNGALAITAGMFLPAFAFSLIFFQRLEAVIEHPALHKAFSGVSAAVVGIIGATFVQLGMAASSRVLQPSIAMALFGVALVAVWRFKGAWVIPTILAVFALAGFIRRRENHVPPRHVGLTGTAFWPFASRTDLAPETGTLKGGRSGSSEWWASRTESRCD